MLALFLGLGMAGFLALRVGISRDYGCLLRDFGQIDQCEDFSRLSGGRGSVTHSKPATRSGPRVKLANGQFAAGILIRVAKAVDQVLEQLLVPRFSLALPTRYGRIIRPERKQFVQGRAEQKSFSLPVDRRQGHFGEREAWHVDLERHAQSGAVVVLAISMEKSSEPIPSGVIWIEIDGLSDEVTATLPLAAEGNGPT